MINETVSPNKDLSTAIRNCWDNFDKEQSFKLIRSIPERIYAVIKAL